MLKDHLIFSQAFDPNDAEMQIKSLSVHPLQVL